MKALSINLKLKQAFIATAGIGGWAAAALWMPSSPLKVLVSALFLLTVPGWLILRWLIGEERTPGFWGELAYSTALSTLFLMFTGLALSAVLPQLGVSRPLEPVPLVTAIALVTTGLAVAVLRKRGSLRAPALSLPTAVSTKLAVGLGAMLPLLAVAGALTLNNGGSGFLTLTMMGLVSAYAVWVLWPRRANHANLYPFALFAMSLGILLATSMRGWFITGHDIMQEFQVFQLTSQAGVWSMNLYHDAYTACLSITILPTILARLTGLADPYVYKLLFQAMFALVPVVLYKLLRFFWPRRQAFLAAFLFLTFPTFITDMMMLCRQELAFLFFSLMLLTLLNDNLERRVRSSLVLLLGLGIILSHYSTSYVAVGMILGAKLLELVVRAWRKRPRSGARPEPMGLAALTWPIALFLGLSVYLWNNQLTSTSQGIARTISGVTVSLPQLFDHTAHTGETNYSLVSKKLSNDQLFAQYQANITRSRDLPASSYYPASVTDHYPVTMAAPQVSAPTALGRQLSKLGVPLGHLYDLLRSGYAILVQLLIIIGLGIMLLRSKMTKLPLQYRLLGASALGMIVLEVLLPSAINYGLLRLIQQSLLILAPAIVLACFLVLKLLKFSPTWRLRVTTLMLVGFFTINSGLLPALTGSFRPDLSSANSGFYYEAYYTHASELAGYAWLKQSTPKGAVVNSDEFARRKMITYAGIFARPSLAPADISKGAYVYLSYGDTTFDRVPFYYNGGLLYEQTPTAFLNDNKNLLYSNGPVEIYK